MPAINYIGAMDNATLELINLIKTRDALIGSWDFYPTEAMINLDPDNNTDIPATPPPFTSVHLEHRTKQKNAGSTGGDRVNFKADGRIITFIPPVGDLSMPSLNTIGERIDHIFLKADLVDEFETINSYEFGDAYQRPYMILHKGQRKKVADTVTIECEIEYEAIV